MKKIYVLSIASLFSVAIVNIANAQTVTGSGTNNRVTKWTNGAGSIIGDCSQLFENTTSVGINTITPNADTKLHIVTPLNTSSQAVKGILITNPATFGSPNGSVSALQATGGATNGNARGSYTATLGMTSTYSNAGGIVGGVAGSINASYINAMNSSMSTMDGVAGNLVLTNFTTLVPTSGQAYVSGVRGWLSGTVTSYPPPTQGSIASILGVDQINGSAGTNGYTYAANFRGRVRIGNGGIITTSQYVPRVGTTHADYLLCVDGKIVARKMVTTALNWADDELKKETSLKDLETEEMFAKNNSHLSDVPSEKEVLDNGIEMSEMFTTHMRKIEQLFKYSFLFNSAINQIKEENISLKKENQEIKKQLSDLQNQINELQNKVNELLQTK